MCARVRVCACVCVRVSACVCVRMCVPACGRACVCAVINYHGLNNRTGGSLFYGLHRSEDSLIYPMRVCF